MAGVDSERARPVTAMLAGSLFFTGVTYASTLPYGAIVGVETLGIPNAYFALVLVVGSLVTAVASVLLGYISDKVRDRRLIVIGCALMGATGYGLIFALRNPLAYVVAYCVIMPIGGTLYSQTFSFARSYYNLRQPERAEFTVSILRTIFAVAWVLVPPVAGWVAAESSVFDVYGIAAAAYLICAAIFAVLLLNPEAKVGVPEKPAGEPRAEPPAGRIERPILFGFLGVILIQTSGSLHATSVPLAIVKDFGGSLRDVGFSASLAAGLEVPLMLMWAMVARRVPKHAIIIVAGLVYALYLVLLGRASSVSNVLWLQGLNAIATAALVSIVISYLQEAIRGRVGLSTSLIDVGWVSSGLLAAALFAALTAAGGSYLPVFTTGAAVCATGVAILFAAHTLMRPRPVAVG